jgi:hypothetical protein
MGGGGQPDADVPDEGSSVDNRSVSSCGACDISAHPLTRLSAPTDCTFEIGQLPPDPNNVRVRATMTSRVVIVPQNDPNGWVYDPGMLSVTLDGSSCQLVREGTFTNLDMLFGCPLCPIP